MVTLFLILLCLALIHFVYEGIILPSLRCKYRYDLFHLRDELRSMKRHRSDDISDEVFLLVQDGVNTSIKFLHAVNVVEAIRWGPMAMSDPDIMRRVRNSTNIVNGCRVNRVKEIDDEAIRIFARVAIYNSGGMLVYLVPIVVLAVWWTKIQRKTVEFTKVIFSASDQQQQQLLPLVPA
jgi:hypothetical protein